MKKDAVIFLKHILESIVLIEEYMNGLTEEDFHKSQGKQDMIIRRLEIIGEATKNLPSEFKEKHINVPWREIAGMRDKISHHYFDINYNIVWDTIVNLLPSFKKEVEGFIKSETENVK